MLNSEKLEYVQVLEPLSRTKSSKIEVFTDFSRLVATALAHGTLEEEYFAVQKRYKNEEMQSMSKAMAVMTQEMEKAPFEDLL